jgi:hypothetical protein
VATVVVIGLMGIGVTHISYPGSLLVALAIIFGVVSGGTWAQVSRYQTWSDTNLQEQWSYTVVWSFQLGSAIIAIGSLGQLLLLLIA